MVLVAPFSFVFWVCYLGGGLSDLLDGFVARRLNQQSKTGALLDSIADFAFAVSLAIIVLIHIQLPSWLWFGILGIALLRFASYAIGYHKYHTFSSLHTYMNKAAGGLIFAFPLLYVRFGLNPACVAVCIVAFLSAVEETVITATSKGLKRDCKGLFFL